jgi:ferric-dicitrate binding protein FerR (iron transport regulator)
VNERDDELSAAEQRALDAWQAPVPPDDFHARVLAQIEADAREHRPRSRRQLAVAALAVMLVGGFFAARLLTGGADTFGEVHLAPSDGAPPAEASPMSDGVRS